MDARGQTETIGVVLLLAITVAGVGVVVAAGGSALDTAQDRSSVQRAEQSMSLLDARSALVALGRTDGQSLTLANSERGSYEVRPDTGRMVVVREGEDNSTTEYLNTTLGSVVYENGDSEVAYQGGGVWRSQGAGAEMVSPPEFNYQGATLTLPAIRVTGDRSSASGGPTARVTRNDAASNYSVFPGDGRTNPLQNGTVTVAVESDYYRGWASFFRSRTTGNVSVMPAENRVELELVARSGSGEFSLGNMPQELRGLAASDPIGSLAFTLRPKNPSKFNSMNWSMVADTGGSDSFRVNVGDSGNGNDLCDGDTLPMTVTYEDGGMTHIWQNDSAVNESGSSFTVDCDGEESTIHLNLTGETNLTYEGGDSPLSNNSIDSNDSIDSIDSIVNYAFADLGPNVELRVEKQGNNQNSAGVELDISTGEVGYASSSERVVTFLHVTENAVNVTVR